MRHRQKITKCISLLLIVLLTQKMGAGLYIHNWLHCQKENPSTYSLSYTSLTKISCNCIDDFCSPYSEPENIVIQEPVEVKHEFVILHSISISPFFKIFHSLRAPPFYIS